MKSINSSLSSSREAESAKPSCGNLFARLMIVSTEKDQAEELLSCLVLCLQASIFLMLLI